MSKSVLVAILCGSSAAGAAGAETNNLVRYGILGDRAAEEAAVMRAHAAAVAEVAALEPP